MPKKTATASAIAPPASNKESGKLYMTELPDGPPQQHVQQTLDSHLRAPSSPPDSLFESACPQDKSVETEQDDVLVVEGGGGSLAASLLSGSAKNEWPYNGSSPDERRRCFEEVARKNALQRRDMAIAKLHMRRSDNLMRQVAMREKRLQPLLKKVKDYKDSLRELIVAASEEEARQKAVDELHVLKKVLREVEAPFARHDARLDRMVATYDSDADVVENTLNGGRASVGTAPSAAATGAAAADGAGGEGGASAASDGGAGADGSSAGKKRRRAAGGGAGSSSSSSKRSAGNSGNAAGTSASTKGAAAAPAAAAAASVSDTIHSTNEDDDDDDGVDTV